MEIASILSQATVFGVSITTALQILISAGLFGLYYFMYRTQQRQAEIQETQNQIMSWQTQLMAAKHKPEIRVEDSDTEDNQFHIKISNTGEGRASNLRTKCLLYYKDNKRYATAFSNQVLGFVILPKESVMERLGKTEKFIGGDEAINTNTENDIYRNSIDSQEDGIVFISDAEFEIKSISPVMDVDFTQAIDQMIEKWDVDAVGFDLYMVYDDVVGQEFPVRVKSVKDIVPQKGMDLSAAIEAGEVTEEPVSTLVPEGGKPEDVRLAEEGLSQ